MKKLTHEQYVQKLNSINPYYVVIGNYINNSTKIIHRHNECGYEWAVQPQTLLKEKNINLCPRCGPKKRITPLRISHDDYLDILKKNGSTMVPLDEYKGIHRKIRHKCSVCNNVVSITPNGPINGRKCKKCHDIKMTKNPSFYFSELLTNHSDIECLGPYINASTKLKHKCKVCDFEWKAKPRDILFKDTGCPKCAKGKYSQMSIDWITSISPNIQHAENAGEYRINLPDGKFLNVDGYDPTTNTVYEFLGDYWHGNPDVYELHNINYHNKKTMLNLYNDTMQRLCLIQEMGYNVVYCWENDWKIICKLKNQK